jgi:hypothetical protein
MKPRPPKPEPTPADWHVPPPGSNGHCLLCGAATTRGQVLGKFGGSLTAKSHRQMGKRYEYRKRSNTSRTGWVIAYHYRPKPKPPKPIKPPVLTKEPPLMLNGPRFRTMVRPKKRPIITPRPFEQCRAYGYTRYSHEENRELSNNPEYQKKEIERFYHIQAPRPEWGRFFHDECSGWAYDLEDRPAGADLLNILQAGDWLIIFHPYRIGRQMDDVMHNIRFFRRTGVVLKIVTIPSMPDFNTYLGDIMLFGMALGAQLQSQSISEYTKAALKHHREMGRCNLNSSFSIPFGCRAEERGKTRTGKPAYYAVPDDSVCTQYAHFLDLYNRGYSWEVIAETANKCGWERSPGRPWRDYEVRKAVKWYAAKIGVEVKRKKPTNPARDASEVVSSSRAWISPGSHPAPPLSSAPPVAAPHGP